jgi:hypothetical protein
MLITVYSKSKETSYGASLVVYMKVDGPFD